jgi:type II secretory pathway pseudopilin PulG
MIVTPISNQNGFSLIMALIAIAIVGALSLAMTTLFNTFNSQSRHFNSMVGARALISTVQGLIAYPNLCTANLDPSTKVFNETQAATEQGFALSLQLGAGASGPKVETGSILKNYDVTVDYLVFRNVALTGGDPAIAGNRLYSGEIALKLKKMGPAKAVSGGTELREKSIGTMIVSVNPTTNIISSCYALVDARQACTDVGGAYDDAGSPRCKMPYPCAGLPNSIFLGYSSSGTPQCKTMSQIVGSLCPAGQYLVSDGAGGTTCKAP